mgnify:CR=1 FL=1
MLVEPYTPRPSSCKPEFPSSPKDYKEKEYTCYGFISSQGDLQKPPEQLAYADLWAAFINKTTAHGIGQIPGARGIL